MVSTYDKKVPVRQASFSILHSNGTDSGTSGDPSVDKKSISRPMGFTSSGLPLSLSSSVRSRLPWLDGKQSPRQPSTQPKIHAESEPPPPNSVPPLSPPSRNHTKLDVTKHKILLDGGYTSSSNPNYPDTSEPQRQYQGRSSFRNRFDSTAIDPRPLRPAHPFQPKATPLVPGGRPFPPAQAPPVPPVTPQPQLPPLPPKSPARQEPALKIHKIELKRRKSPSLEPETDAPQKHEMEQIRPLARDVQFTTRPLPQSNETRWLARPKSKIYGNSTSDISPLTRQYGVPTERERSAKREERKSFHEPEMKAAINKLESLIQEAEELNAEPIAKIRRQGLKHQVPSLSAYRPADVQAVPRPGPRRHTPLRFVVADSSSSESTLSDSTTSTSGTVITPAKSKDQYAINRANTQIGETHDTVKVFVDDIERPLSRGRARRRSPDNLETKLPTRSTSLKRYDEAEKPKRYSYQPKKHDHSTCAFNHRPENVHKPRTSRAHTPEAVLRHRRRSTGLDSPPMPWSRSTVASAVDADNELRPKQEQPVRNSFPAPQKTKYDKYNPFLESTAYRVDVERPRPRRSKRDDNHRMSRSEKLRYRKDPIARRWPISRKRFTAATVCVNTALMGLIIGIYAGMVPRIQFQLADQKHYVLFGNIVLYLGLAFTTFICWPLPLLHGRKPYTLAALALLLPLQFPQAILVHSYHSPVLAEYEASLLLCRFLTGMLLGLANINLFSTMLDLYGSSLMSHAPHQEIVILNDVRREGGGLGLWLGIWTWCFTSSISVGFVCGAGIIFNLNPEWGFYITGILMAFVLVLNILTPETRRVAHRRSFKAYLDADEKVRKKLVKGEIKLHIHDEGPSNCFQEVWAGMVLCKRMFMQKGFCVLSLYLGWIYGQNVLLIVLIGALLSVGYDLPSWGVGLGVASIAIGSLLAVPLTKGGLFSRARKQGPRSDSDTYKRQVTWSSHLVRRVVFMVALPIFGIAYTLASPGMQTHYMIPIVFAGFIGFLSNLAITECHGLIMETFDTCDLQPGVNSRHRLQSLSESVIMRRTAYTSYPRVSAGIFLSQTIGFIVAALATGVGGYITRHLGAQISTGATAVILMMLTILLTLALWRYKSLQVIPDKPFGVKLDKDGRADEYWKPVVIGNPSGKTRKMSLLEMGGLSRWSEIRKLNKLVPDTAARK